MASILPRATCSPRARQSRETLPRQSHFVRSAPSWGLFGFVMAQEVPLLNHNRPNSFAKMQTHIAILYVQIFSTRLRAVFDDRSEAPKNGSPFAVKALKGLGSFVSGTCATSSTENRACLVCQLDARFFFLRQLRCLKIGNAPERGGRFR